jgi:hypothetical protein
LHGKEVARENPSGKVFLFLEHHGNTAVLLALVFDFGNRDRVDFTCVATTGIFWFEI